VGTPRSAAMTSSLFCAGGWYFGAEGGMILVSVLGAVSESEDELSDSSCSGYS
jgi:hypothetical protein